MFIAALFTKAKLCPTTDEWIKKMWYLYTMEFYSAMKKNEILSFASKWIELELFLVLSSTKSLDWLSVLNEREECQSSQLKP
jgi:hypothetical protein